MAQAKMQRAHFELIADTIAFADLDQNTRQHIAAEFARAVARTNPQFAADKFTTRAMGSK